MEMKTYLKINPADSVVVCLQPKKKETSLILTENKSL